MMINDAKEKAEKGNVPAVLLDIVRGCGVKHAQAALLRVAHERSHDVLHDGADGLAVGLLELVLLSGVHRAGVGSPRPDAIAVWHDDTLDETILDEEKDSKLSASVQLIWAKSLLVRVDLRESEDKRPNDWRSSRAMQLTSAVDSNLTLLGQVLWSSEDIEMILIEHQRMPFGYVVRTRTSAQECSAWRQSREPKGAVG
jgi:hypothetical protein